ncbi:MAG: N-acetylmuramoyl-L-alanine amidase [Nitrospirae bacterium]|nr:MAG: N-acetylmuramoyl-L-alanine amidase [Nitrospirota bacterium]
MNGQRLLRVALFLTFFLLFFLFSFGGHALEKKSLRDIRFSEQNGVFRLVVEFDSLPTYRVGVLHNPERVYFDFEGVDFKKRGSLQPVSSVIKGIRWGVPKRGVLRLVVDLKRALPHKYFTIKSPPRVVLDIGHEKNPFYREQKVVVIDPGHGGHDPGAIGPTGLKEKEVTLRIARLLKQILEERYNLKVYLTRSDDRYLELRERTSIANRRMADLFVSIHANASPRRKTSGIETYLLNWTNDQEALRVAARENQISVEKMKQKQSELGMILASLRRESKRDESLKLAHYIQRSLVGRLNRHYRVKNLGVKQALFYVLVDADMPSVLVEVGFISNPREERLLRSRNFRKKTAEAIASGIFRYILSRPDAPKLAMQTDNLPKL